VLWDYVVFSTYKLYPGGSLILGKVYTLCNFKMFLSHVIF
jgi:hypothetical protein